MPAGLTPHSNCCTRRVAIQKTGSTKPKVPTSGLPPLRTSARNMQGIPTSIIFRAKRPLRPPSTALLRYRTSSLALAGAAAGSGI